MIPTARPLHEAVADVVRDELRRRDLQTSDVARVTGMSPAAARAAVAGVRPFTLEELDALAPVLGSRSADLIAAARDGLGHLDPAP